ncbi:MAG: hypothetical protein CMJ67_08110 [Planctomycetaceae bacterium]|nr:hypothetical protein [Planctomycetaceae bacterium]
MNTQPPIPKPVIIPPDSADVIEFYPGNEVRFRITGEQTNGRLELFDRVAPAGETLADMHLHLDTTETFRVLEGTVELSLGTEIRELGPGGLVIVPPGLPHAMRNRTDQRVVMQIMFTPARNHPKFFHDLKEEWPGLQGRNQALTDRLRREFGGFTCDPHGHPLDGLPA